MSSNTLRGIGQEEDGDTDATASGKGMGTAAAAPGRPPETAVEAAVQAAVEAGRKTGMVGDAASAADDLTERIPDSPKSLSLDTPMPGTRSLDSSVPDARPSLDAKVPHLAATLMGVMAPKVNAGNRDKGTVQGRDVHLPAESKGLAGGRAIPRAIPAAGSGATPLPVEHSEPTRADPVWTAALAQDANDRSGVMSMSPPARPVDSNSHGPWYDQDPTGGNEVYEDEKPSVVGRAAIGVAFAAGLSVVVFAVLRMTTNSEDGYRRPPPVVYEPSSRLPAGPGAASPSPASSVATQTPAGKPSAAANPGEAPSPTGAAAAVGGGASLDGPDRSARSGAAVVGPTAGSTGRPTVARVGPAGARSGGRAVTPGRTTAGDSARLGTTSEGGAVISAPPPSHTVGSAPPFSSFSSSSSAPAEIVAPPPPPAASKPTPPSGPDKARGKGYDPDSTLPLNLD
jgi:hypothetical protein